MVSRATTCSASAAWNRSTAARSESSEAARMRTASSGRTHRHRLNRGGDRAANHALHTVALCRLRYDPRTRIYVERRTKQGLSKTEIIRCLKRYIIREIYAALPTIPHANDLGLAA